MRQNNDIPAWDISFEQEALLRLRGLALVRLRTRNKGATVPLNLVCWNALFDIVFDCIIDIEWRGLWYSCRRKDIRLMACYLVPGSSKVVFLSQATP